MQGGQLHLPRCEPQNRARRGDGGIGVQAAISGCFWGDLRVVLVENTCLRLDATKNSVLQGHETLKGPKQPFHKHLKSYKGGSPTVPTGPPLYSR